jgi:hypothetical protein
MFTVENSLACTFIYLCRRCVFTLISPFKFSYESLHFIVFIYGHFIFIVGKTGIIMRLCMEIKAARSE